MSRILVPRPAPADHAPVFHDEIALIAGLERHHGELLRTRYPPLMQR